MGKEQCPTICLVQLAGTLKTEGLCWRVPTLPSDSTAGVTISDDAATDSVGCQLAADMRLGYHVTMRLSKTIRLHTAKNPARSLALHYRDEPVGLKQARLAGRRTLVPAIDLEVYTCRAVIDWASITFDLSRPTQFRYVQDALTPLFGRRPHVVPSSPDPGGVATVFTVTFQEPSLAALKASQMLLREKFGGASEPFINEVEVSVDFKPRTPSDDSRSMMVAVLGRHLYPGRKFHLRATTRPRFSWGSGRHQNSPILRRSRLALDDGDLFLNPAGDTAPPVDATYYIGHRKVGPLWRVMDKVIDRQNQPAGTWIDLPEEEQRARVEVRLDQLELKALGVNNLDHLLGFKFAALQGPYFKFMLPTFAAQTTSMSAADRRLERARVERFFNVGVVGLRAMDEQRRGERAKHRPTLTGHLRAKGRPTPVSDRGGAGAFGTFVAYALMNDRVAMALRKLGERERKKLQQGY